LRRHGRHLRHAIVVGDGGQAFDPLAHLNRRADLGYRVVELIPLDPRGNGNGTGSAAVLGRIETLAASQPIDEVFVALPLGGTQPLIRALVSLCEEQGITLRLVSSGGDLILARAQLDEVEGRPVVTIFSGAPATRARAAPFSWRPGMTCLRQVNGHAPEFEDWVKTDMAYIDNWSLGLDLKILLQALPAVLSGRGAHSAEQRSADPRP